MAGIDVGTIDDATARLRARMREFIDGEVIPAEPDLIADDASSAKVLGELRSRAKELGLWALGHPADVGGGGVPFMEFAFLNEIIGRSEFGQLAVGSVTMQDTIMLHKHGSASQRARWIPGMVSGDILPSVGLTEPEVAGSDPTLIATRAELDGDEWVINGPQMVHRRGESGRLLHGVRPHRGRLRAAPRPHQFGHRADRYTRIRHRPLDPHHGP